MASSSSSSSSERRCKYDVFLNFRGEGTRKIFVGHLHKALELRGLKTFIDSEDVGKGHDLSVLLEAISDSKLSIVVFSQDYASSTWCLKELVQILKCNATQKQIVVPIFYQLDPSHVRKQEASFAQAFLKHESNRDLQEVQSWRSALTQAANFSGWDSRDYKDDAKLIDAIAVDVFHKLIHIPSREVSDDLVGMDSPMHIMRRLLRLSGGTSDVVYVGIWGMGGIGKTTIAKAVYNNIARLFEHSCFLDNVRERFTGKDTRQMQVEFLSELLNEKVKSLGGGYMMMLERLGERKILVVLDDVDDSNQIDTLLGKKRSFGGGSKIIVTTRDEHVLQPHDEFKIYKPKPLSDGDALKLFSQNAFKKNKPSEEYDHLSRRALEYAQGLPLALRILGSHLHNKSVSVWKDELEKIKKIPNTGIQREMGREIIHSESPNKPWKRSRLWSYEDVQDALTRNKATKVEGIMVELPDSKDMYLNAEGFVSMTNLRLLRITYPDVNNFYRPENPILEMFHNDIAFFRESNQKLNGDPKFLSHKLRVLVWHDYPLKALPSNFDPKNLVDLDMRFSRIEQLWVGTKRIKELISINLSYCKYLKEIPLCTEATKLEKLILKGCTSLLEVHPSISALEKLVFWSLEDCTKLKILPSSIHHLKSLKFLDLCGCSNLEMFPDISEDMEALSELKLDETAIKELPSSIERLRRLKSLSMENCTSLVCLPDNICNLADLMYLYLSGCSQLRNLPKNFGSLESLLELELHNSGIEKLPVSILRLKLGKLSFYGCERMKAPLSSWRSSSIEGRWNAVVFIDFRDCNLLELSDAIAHFSSLKILELSGTNLKSLPSTMNRLDFLERLELEGCKRLKSIPELSSSISYINANNCTTLETISTPKRPYDMGRYFTFCNCWKLVQNDLFRDIVETHFPPQGNYSRHFYICFPGSEIPERFIHQCKGSSVTAQLPLNWVDNKVLGFSICAVIGHWDYYSVSSAQCFCTLKGNHCEYRFSFYGISEIRPFKGNHMCLGYVPWSEFGINGEEVNECRYTEAKFEIQCLGPLFIQRCGVQFFFANNNEVAHQDFGEPMVQSERQP
ncbi:hypothetical protein M0R45_035878 [Rubus argutus]|uniref:ADP-ribosyl cyclase/cyclic ADP-ribose hydrolase n=1 Tax=Rubus argutus TaxID=59490 RepID=A0AAW1VYN5_RUBAR